jgi:RecB family exonuclease
MPRRLIAAYPTRLTTWVDCRRRYLHTYLDPRPKAGPWAHFSVGSSVHEALRRWWDEPVPLRTPERAAELVKRHWIDQGFRDAEQSRAALARAQGWVRSYVVGLDPTSDPVGLERTVGAVTAVVSIRGRVDRIDERVDEDGRRMLVVVDYKTSRRPSTEVDARSSLQLAMYSAAVERTLRAPCPRVELHHVPTGTVAAWDYRPGQRERQLERADAVALEIQEAEEAWRGAGGVDAHAATSEELFPPSTGNGCSWCDVRSSCPQGQAAAPAVTAWAALDRADERPLDAKEAFGSAAEA